MFLNRSFVCSEISSLCESHDSGFYKQKGKRFSLMIINGIWVWGILRRGFKKRTIYCWKELVLGRKWWEKKIKFWLQTQFGHNLSTLSWSWFRSFAQCYSLPFPSNGLAQGHVPDIVKPLLFSRNITYLTLICL